GGWILIPVPLEKKRLRWRGFNQAEEIGKHLSFYFKIPLLKDVLMKIKETPAQVELEAKTRKEILRRAFFIKNKSLIENKKIILVDDIYTTGSTMEECARILKEAGAKEIIGIVVARASPGQDKFQNL
ncbi:MAG: phosphoribosyltransferase family protein, partial [Bacillota bacterium]|nr:phosphoribosyltransferase family protein [Bacillota bacterium]